MTIEGRRRLAVPCASRPAFTPCDAMRACCALLVFVVVVLPQRAARVEAIPKYFTFYGDDPDNQHEWSNLGTSGITGIKGIQPLPPGHAPPRSRPP